MWPVLIRFIETLSILYLIVSYVLGLLVVFISPQQEAVKEAPLPAKLLIFMMSPLIVLDFLLSLLLPKKEHEDKK